MNCERDGDVLDIAIGGFGSAGAGNRSGRRIASRAGIGSTASERNRRILKASCESKIAEPPPDELMRWIDAGRCWWCGDDKEYRSLSQHFIQKHGIDLQWVRDYLHVPKRHPFISEDLHQSISERSRRLYDPQKFRGVKNTSRKLSAFGVESNRIKALRFRERLGESGMQEHLATMRATGTAKRTQMAEERRRTAIYCVVCGGEVFWPHGKMPTKTCSDKCHRELRSRVTKQNIAKGALPAIRERLPKTCKGCGDQFYHRHRTTCSDECAHKVRSDHAKAALWKLQKAKAAFLTKLAVAPKRLCSVAGCERPHRSLGLCESHYRRDRAAHRKAESQDQSRV